MAMTQEEKDALIQKYYTEGQGIGATEKPVYAGTYDDQIKQLYQDITDRNNAGFSYDLNGDAMWEQMKDSYTQQGKLAMKDTMGQASALTGGYGSSYGQAVGQQQYDAYLQNLTDQIPELWNMAYKVWGDQGTALSNQLSQLQGFQADEYSKYRDQLSDYNYAQTDQYNKYTDAVNRALNEENTQYNREQDALSRQQTLYGNLTALISATGYVPTDDELSAAGLSRQAANALAAEYQRQVAASASSGGSGGGSGSSGKYTISAKEFADLYNSNLSDAEKKAIISDASNAGSIMSAYDRLKNSKSTSSTKNSVAPWLT